MKYRFLLNMFFICQTNRTSVICSWIMLMVSMFAYYCCQQEIILRLDIILTNGIYFRYVYDLVGYSIIEISFVSFYVMVKNQLNAGFLILEIHSEYLYEKNSFRISAVLFITSVMFVSKNLGCCSICVKHHAIVSLLKSLLN